MNNNQAEVDQAGQELAGLPLWWGISFTNSHSQSQQVVAMHHWVAHHHKM